MLEGNIEELAGAIALVGYGLAAIGPGIGICSADQVSPSTMATIIGFLSSPMPSARRTNNRIRPSRAPVTRMTIG